MGGLLARVFGLLPRAAIPGLGALLGWLAGRLFGIRRAHVESSMRRAGIVRSRSGVITRMMYESLGTSLVEMLWLAAHPEVPASRWATIDEYSRALLADAHERGRGVVIATAHTGNWELAAAALAELRPLTVVVKPMSVGWVDRFCRAARTARGMALSTPDGALDCARRALERGELVAMIIDQVPGHARHVVQAEFLCGRADVDRSAAALAAAARVPLVVAVSRRLETGGHVLEVVGVMEPPAKERRAWVEEATRMATRILERWVHAHPADWLWMHRRWRSAPGTAAKRAPGSWANQSPPNHPGAITPPATSSGDPRSVN